MKKIIASFTVFLFLCSAPVVFAQMPVPMTAAVIPTGLERIGVVAATQGKVELKMPGQVGRIAKSGQPIYMGEMVNTDEKGHLQILLLDETVFTIGPNSAITIDKFVYDPKTTAGEIKASISKGVFRYVSGKIAIKNPNKVTVKLPTTTLGFRGTIVGGSVEANGQGLVGLLGPGGNNDAGARTGSFTIDGGGDQQSVDRTGFGVEIGENGGLSDVFQLSEDQVSGLTGGLGTGGQGGGGGGTGGGGDNGGGLGGDTDMGGLSGENNALAGDMVGLTEGTSGLTDGLNDLTTLVAQDKLANDAIPVVDAATTFEQLRAASGSGHYVGEGSYVRTESYGGEGPYSGGSGGYTAAGADIVFGPNGYIGGSNSFVYVNDGSSYDRTPFGVSGSRNFDGSGPATFSWKVESEKFPANVFDITVTLKNVEGVTAEQARVDVTYINNSTSALVGPAGGTGTVTASLNEGPLNNSISNTESTTPG